MEPTASPAVYRTMDPAVSAQSLETAVARFREEYRIVKAGLAAARAVPPHRLRALRIRLRTFLDQHRRALPRGEAAALRSLIDDVDHTIAGL